MKVGFFFFIAWQKTASVLVINGAVHTNKKNDNMQINKIVYASPVPAVGRYMKYIDRVCRLKIRKLGHKNHNVLFKEECNVHTLRKSKRFW